MASVLHALGVRAAFVFHSSDGLDELTTTGINHVARFDNGSVHEEELDACDLGLSRASRQDLRGGQAQENAGILRSILAGAERGPKRDVVTLNAAAALVAGGKADDLGAGLKLASDAIDSGRAISALDGLVALSNSFRSQPLVA
jgi:anthranilate phosphoribosyltransferase